LSVKGPETVANALDIFSNNYWKLKFTASEDRICYFIFKRCTSYH
jgi:hypothetical protein